MSYHQRNNSLSDKSTMSENLPAYYRNKENVPMNSALSHHSSSSSQSNGKSLTSRDNKSTSLLYNNYNKFFKKSSIDSKATEAFKKRENFSKYTQDRKEPVLPYNLDSNNHFNDSKELSGIQNHILEEKDNLVNEFRCLGEKLKQLKFGDSKKPPMRRHSISRSDKTDFDAKKSTCGQDSEIFHNEILNKLDELNSKYKQLATNISTYQKIPTWEDQKPTPTYSRASIRSANSMDSKKLETFEDARTDTRVDTRPNIGLGHGLRGDSRDRLSTGDYENRNGFITMKRESSVSYQKDEKERELERRERDLQEKLRQIKEREDMMRRKEAEYNEMIDKKQDFEAKMKSLIDIEGELKKREGEINERNKRLEENENEFEELTERLERQSEELTNQKLEFTKNVEAFSSRVGRFEEEREEFNKYEKEFNEKNIELRNEQDRLRILRDQIASEQEMNDQRCRDIRLAYEELNANKALEKEREDILQAKEFEMEKKIKKYEEDLETMNREKEEFITLVTMAEKKLQMREEELNEREILLNTRRDKYDDFDLKLLGMRLNEEVWQKRRDIEVGALQEEIHRIREREKQLERREAKLMKFEQTGQIFKPEETDKKIDVVDMTLSAKTVLNTEQSWNDPSLLPLSARTYKTDELIGLGLVQTSDN